MTTITPFHHSANRYFADISLAVQGVLKNAPEQFILGAECTVPGNTDWNNLKLAIKTAHQLEH